MICILSINYEFKKISASAPKTRSKANANGQVTGTCTCWSVRWLNKWLTQNQPPEKLELLFAINLKLILIVQQVRLVFLSNWDISARPILWWGWTWGLVWRMRVPAGCSTRCGFPRAMVASSWSRTTTSTSGPASTPSRSTGWQRTGGRACCLMVSVTGCTEVSNEDSCQQINHL